MVQLAADVCGVPTAVINIFDQTTVHPLAGLDAGLLPVPREQALCELVVRTGTELITADARLEPRLADNPHVAEPGGRIRFYASIPLTTAAGHTVGTLCTYDLVTRELSESQVKLLRALAKQALGIFELREALARSAAASRALAVLVQQADEVLETSMDASYSLTMQGVVLAWNRAAVTLFGYTAEEAVGSELATLIIPAEFRGRFLASIRDDSMQTGGVRRVIAHRKNGHDPAGKPLFEPFQRLDRAGEREGHHGLGLSIVRAIANAHDRGLGAGGGRAADRGQLSGGH